MSFSHRPKYTETIDVTTNVSQDSDSPLDNVDIHLF